MEDYTNEMLQEGNEISLKQYLEDREADTEKRLQEYYLQLATDAEAMKDRPVSEERLQLYNTVKKEAEELKQDADALLKAHMRTSAQADELETRLHETQKSHKKRRLFKAAPANSVIDLEERKTGHFAQGLNIYKVLIVCYIGSFAGVMVELLWCLMKNGYLESRSGLVYGPFNLLYGAGAVALTLALYQYRNRSSSISFLGGMIVGSVVEYICSWGQELLFGSRSWDYSHMPFNINGRICLLYSVFWGFLGVMWIKSIYPRMAKWILKIPNKIGRVLTWALLAFFIFNAAMSLISVNRWAERTHGIEASNAFESFIDDRFPDPRMEKIFANMTFN